MFTAVFSDRISEDSSNNENEYSAQQKNNYTGHQRANAGFWNDKKTKIEMTKNK